MIKRILGYKPLFLLLAISLLGTGCVERSAPEVTYYSLLTSEQLGSAQPVGAYPDLSLGIGPVTIPDSLKRSQVATRQEGNQYTFSEFHRWAGVLENDFSAVLGDNLGDLLGVSKVASFPWMPHFKPSHRVVVEVLRFDGSLDSEAVLSARWAVADAEGKASLAMVKSVYQRPLERADYAALVKAQSELLADLSREIATEISRLAAQ